jgi:hypothetical protein
VKASKIDFSTLTLAYVTKTSNFSTSNTSPTQVTGLTATVTIPTGVTNIKVSAYCSVLYCSAVHVAAILTLWNGAVGAGVQLNAGRGFQSGSSGTGSPNVSARIPVTPGSTYTFNVGLNADTATTATAEGAATRPLFLMVEAS